MTPFPLLEDGSFRAHFRFTAGQVEELLQRVGPLIQQPRRLYRQPDPHNQRQTSLPLQQRLLCFLHLMASGCSFEEVASRVGLHPSTVHQDFVHVLHAVLDGLDPLLRWPSVEEMEQLAGNILGFPSAVGHVDGTVQLIRRPLHQQRRMYTGFKKVHCWHHLVVCDWTGRIRFLSTMNGATNDKRHFSASPLEQRAGEYLGEHWELLADGGFTGKPRCITPFSVQQVAQQPERAQFNREQRAERVVVEYAIGRVKCLWTMVQRPFRGYKLKAPFAFRAAVLLTNFYWFVRGRYPRDRNHLLRRERHWEQVLREEGLLERRNAAVAQQQRDVGADGEEQEEFDEERAREEHMLRVIEQLEE